MTIKPKTITVYDKSGGFVRTASSTTLFYVDSAAPAFTVGANEKCYVANPYLELSPDTETNGPPYAAFTVVCTIGTVTWEIKMRYTEGYM